MADTSPFIIKEHLVMHMFAYKEGRSGQKYDEIRANFALHFNNAALTDDNLCKPEIKHS
jgi:hypothetical protein